MTSAHLDTCFSPAAEGKRMVYTVENVPANSVLLKRTRQGARQVPRGSIELAFCPQTGFLTNQAFATDSVRYDEEYEATQSFSDTFSWFHRRLASDLIERYDLHQKKIVEIGCGNGEFLTLLCEQGENEGLGFDPAHQPERRPSGASRRLHIIQSEYSDVHAPVEADFVCCKMTLEHIPDPAAFIGMVRRTLKKDRNPVVFFQVPEARRILQEVAFWDIYHEHCSYFSAGSLTRLFRTQGFTVQSVWTGYDGQYLMIEACLNDDSTEVPLPIEEPVSEIADEVERFATRAPERVEAWQALLTRCWQQDLHLALWGGGSKAVAFLTTLGLGPEVGSVVDINPHKQGTYLPGTGHEIVPPDALRAHSPDIVLIMNPIYDQEIRSDLQDLSVEPVVWHVDTDPTSLLRSLSDR